MMKKLVVGTAATVAALLLMTSAASAHFCTNASRSEKGNEQVAAHSRGWLSLDDFLRFAGVCDDGVAYVMAGFEGTAWEDLTIHGRTVMAQGLEDKDTGLLNDDKGIDHLSGPDFVAIEGLFEDLVGDVYAEGGACA